MAKYFRIIQADSDPIRPALLYCVILTLGFVSAGLQLARVELPEQTPLRYSARLMNVDREFSVPAIFSGVVLLAVALTLWMLGQVSGDRAWLGLSVVFGLVTFDEVFAIHERSIEPLRSLFGIESGPLYFAWVIPGVIVAAAVAIGMWRHLLSLALGYRVIFIVSGAIFLLGAVGFEMIGGAFASSVGVETAHERWEMIAIVTVEELLEMFGAALFLISTNRLLRELSQPQPQPSPTHGGDETVISLDPPPDAPAPTGAPAKHGSEEGQVEAEVQVR